VAWVYAFDRQCSLAKVRENELVGHGFGLAAELLLGAACRKIARKSGGDAR
jgi:hypothetical protein